jgi:hypothetical protein
MELFRPTLKRFLLRNPRDAETRKQRAWLKMKSAIFDKQKFQGLINHLKDLIDQLFMIPFNHILPVDATRLGECIRMDIELIGNIAHLSLVQEACEDSYRSWSEHAASVIEASGVGAVGRRDVGVSGGLECDRLGYRAPGMLRSVEIGGPISGT